MSNLLIEATQLSAIRGEGEQRTVVLEDASFSIARGEVVAIVGPSGSGKTTVLSLLGGLERPTQGRLEVDGIDLASVSEDELGRHRRERVGFVFQMFHLLPMLDAHGNVETALEPLGLPRPQRHARAAAALEAVGLAAKARRFPHQLSGGEQQRVGLARALAKDPPLLLADEPTGSLDAAAGRQVLELLLASRGPRRDRTLVLVTHDMEAAARADRRLVLRDRRIHPA